MKTIGMMLIVGWLCWLTIDASHAMQDAKGKAMEYCLSATGGALGSQVACENEVYGKDK